MTGGTNSYFSKDGVKVSSSRFEELVSLYIDNEATSDENSLLSSVVSHDRAAHDLFVKTCKIHAATCRIYGREAKFQTLDAFAVAKPKVEKAESKISRSKIYFEWACVFGLMMLSFVFFYAASPDSQTQQMESSIADSPSYSYSINGKFASVDDSYSSIIVLE